MSLCYQKALAENNLNFFNLGLALCEPLAYTVFKKSREVSGTCEPLPIGKRGGITRPARYSAIDNDYYSILNRE